MKNVINATIPIFCISIDRDERSGTIHPVVAYEEYEEDKDGWFFPLAADYGDGTISQVKKDVIGYCYDYGEYRFFDFADSEFDVPMMEYIFNKCIKEKITCVDIDENCKEFREYMESKMEDSIRQKKTDG